MNSQESAFKRFTSRKWCLAVVYTVLAWVGLFTDKLTGGETVSLAVAVMGLYKVFNWLDNRP